MGVLHSRVPHNPIPSQMDVPDTVRLHIARFKDNIFIQETTVEPKGEQAGQKLRPEHFLPLWIEWIKQ